MNFPNLAITFRKQDQLLKQDRPKRLQKFEPLKFDQLYYILEIYFFTEINYMIQSFNYSLKINQIKQITQLNLYFHMIKITLENFIQQTNWQSNFQIIMFKWNHYQTHFSTVETFPQNSYPQLNTMQVLQQCV
ncbi:unnamed protein product [Paramecium octaurelia]|uniref:Uncharacterized protein n=1 Tax=Paramecium octaurelia TaxID=43137 RepID=A0A8S1XWV4_PAROT|nr:unnamed protein product [Paramecium octaurelia]